MPAKMKLAFLLIALVLCLGVHTPDSAVARDSQITAAQNLSPENTAIVANHSDAVFSRDFSPLLRQLRLEWIILDSASVPDSIQGKNLVLLGHPDSQYTGEVIRSLLSPDEIEQLQAATTDHVVLEKESPWRQDRSIIICSGMDLVLRRNAAEEAVRAIIASAPPASEWIKTTYAGELDSSLREFVKLLQYEWEDQELPLADLTMEIGAEPPGTISAQQAEGDVERLFNLFSHGYSGYGFYNQHGEFDQAKERILEQLPSRSSWSGDSLAGLLYEHLGFIGDCHLTIGDHRFARHSDFWYDTKLEFALGDRGYQYYANGTTFTLVSVDHSDPSAYLLPSINKEGEPIYRLGLLSREKPHPLILVAESDEGERQFEIKLRRSDFNFYSEDIFREDVIGGIPVVRARSFGDYYADELNQFVETASQHRGDPVLILDIRGNGGGNERWPIRWIQRLTDQRAEAVFVSSELESKTSMTGRLNAFNYWYKEYEMASYRDEIVQFTRKTEMLEDGRLQARWTGPYYPRMPLIANDTTVIVIMNDGVASAGEGLVMRISQVENVVVVGENSMGCLTFGNISTHKLPHSGLMVWMPINFGIFLDQEIREGEGLLPDLWVPAAEAVDYTIAALRKGTITTYEPLSQDTLESDFTTESHWSRFGRVETRTWLIGAIFLVGISVWTYFMRKKTRILLGTGIVWLFFSVYWLAFQEAEPVGLWFLLGAVVCLALGGINLVLARQNNLRSSG